VNHSEWLTAAALTQTYAYMIENGPEYSRVVTEEADIFPAQGRRATYTLLPPRRTQDRSRSTRRSRHLVVSYRSQPDLKFLLDDT